MKTPEHRDQERKQVNHIGEREPGDVTLPSHADLSVDPQ
jgi:hypothetical protein